MAKETQTRSVLLTLPRDLFIKLSTQIKDFKAKFYFITQCRSLYAMTQNEQFWRLQVAGISECHPMNLDKEKHPYQINYIGKLQTYHAIYKAIVWLNELELITMLEQVCSIRALSDLVMRTPKLRQRLLSLKSDQCHWVWQILRKMDKIGPEISTYALKKSEIREIILSHKAGDTYLANIAQHSEPLARMIATDRELLEKACQHGVFCSLRSISRLTGVTFSVPKYQIRVVKGVAMKYTPTEKDNECADENTTIGINPS